MAVNQRGYSRNPMSAGGKQAVQHPEPQQEAPAISVRAISKVYGPAGSGVLAVENLSLEVARGEFVCLVGASGCGKSTLLKLIAGLGSPGAGQITVNGRTSLLFQEAALFPWLTARKNIELALKLQRVPPEDRRSKAAELLDLVHLTAFADKRPHELSGGMRQRVALARALAQQAQVILMDEPFASLDAITRDVLYEELEQIWEQTDLSALLVTHNVAEAVRLADRVLLLSSRPGRVAAEFPIEAPRPRRPDDPAVAHLAGEITERLKQEVRRHAKDPIAR